MFTRSSIPKKEYCLKHENVTIDKHLVNEKTLAVLAGISKEKGMETYMIFENSVNIPKFKEYLLKLRSETGDDKICIFLDNLTTHTSNKSKEEMRNLGFRYIFNVAYAPDYNPIEFIFSKIKQKFRSLRAQKLVGTISDSHENLIHKAIKYVRKKDIVNCVQHV